VKKFLLIIIIVVAWQFPSREQGLVVGFSFDTVCWHMITHFRSWSYPDTVYPPRDSIVSQSWDLLGTGQFGPGTGPLDSIIYDSPGIHTVGLKVTTLKGYMKILYQLVPVNQLIPAFSAKTGCLLEPVVFTNQTIVKGDTSVFYIWDFGDGSLPVTTKNASHVYSDTGQYSVTLTARFHIGCQTDTIKIVAVKSNLAVNLGFSRDTIMYAGDTLKVNVLDPSTFDSIRWSTRSTSDTIVITKAGLYSVTAYQGDCYTTKSFNVTVNSPPSRDPVISNLFTPNGDGFNDHWEILNLSDAGPCQVNVFNRYGEQVYSSSDYQNDWDGTSKGKRLANDTYYYFVRCVNQVLVKGNVTILK
jgi:gliding motility-associated-like protein